ncbi:DUF2164 domain-containing protein [Verrucomicrobiota bacterium]
MPINLSHEEKRDAVCSIQRYLGEELEVDISEMQADFLLDYFFKELAPFAYNKGVKDAKEFFLMKAEDLEGTCFEEGLSFWDKNKRKVSRKKT